MGDWDFSHDPLAALRDGDPAPFEAFVESHARRLLAWFRRQGAGLHRAEDLTQDVFVKLHNSAARYVAQERFGPYCLRVARNLWTDECRRLGVRPTTLSLEGTQDTGRQEREALPLGASLDPARVRRGPGTLPGPDRQASVEEEEARVWEALQTLSPSHREVFELAVLEGLPYPDVADVLGVPVGTVKSRVYYALRKLRSALEELGVDADAWEDTA